MLVTYLEASQDLCETDSILFGAALAVCRIIGAKLSTAGRATGQSSAIPAWRIRIEERIAKARALVGRLICFRSGNTRPRIVRTVRMAFAGTNVSLSQPDIMQKLTERINDLKQRIAAWGKRIRRSTERSTRFNQNRLFQSDQKRLYKSLERPIVRGTGPAPNQADTVAFWRSLWSEPVNHNEGPWTEVVASQCAGITPMDPVIITPDDVAEAVRRAPNWKSPGLDGLHHYWLKGFMVCHAVLARQFQEALNQKSLPSLFTTGITHLVPKDQDATDPSKYRPITWPLPGGRRGASGAGAGRGSMRAASRARGAARSPTSPPHPSSPPDGLMSAGSSRTRQAASAAGGVRRMRWTRDMNANALRAYYRAKGEETAGIAYRARMHCFFAELEPSIPVTDQNLADRVRYIMRSKIFDDAELERLRREAIPSPNELATAGDEAPQATDQLPRVEAAMDLPVVGDSDDDEMVSHELEQMRSILEQAILETRSMPLENRPRLPRIPLSKRNRAVVRALNPMLVTYLEASRDLCETDSVLFGAAVAACRIIGAKLPMAGRATKQSSAIPAWRKRIEDRIAKARALIGRLISFRSGNNRPRVVRTVRMAFAGTNISLSQPDITQKLTERIDDLKQKIAAWGKRIRRFTERSRRFNQNRLFQSDQKRLYKSLERPEACGAGPGPDQANTVAFWRGLWSEPVNHSEGPWTEVVASQCASITPMDPVIITPDDVAEAVRRAPNWKSPGLDGLHHYWLKGFMVCHAVLARQFQEALNQKSLPSLFTTGITHLVPKDQGNILIKQDMATMTDTYGTTGQLTLKWDPKNLEIRTTSVERTLEPLVLQVTTLVNSKDKTAKKKRPGKSKRASALVATVERATEIFIERGQNIAYENPEITQEMLAAVEEVRKAGAAMSLAAREFSEEPCASSVRSAMVRAARALLSAVTRLLILADMVDVHLLLAKLRAVETDLDKLKCASSQSELVESARQLGRSAAELGAQAARRQHELKEPRARDELAAARAVLKKHSTMLLTASKVYVRHPELAAAKANRDFVLRAVCSAVDTISAVAQGRPLPTGNNRPPIEGPGELAQALDDFDERMVMEPLAYSELRTRPSLEERLESIISGAALMADSSCTRDERRERIVAECNAVRQALQDLLHEYINNAGKAEQSEGLDRAIEHMCRKTRDLRRQLRKAVVDHVSDSFLETNVPLLVLMEAARNGNEKEVEEYAVVFTEHANKLVEVANLVCSMSNNEDGVKMVRHAAAQIEALCPQVINAAMVLAARCRSRVAQDNGAAFASAWRAAVRLLTLAVDDLTTIDDFLAVSENHILEDVNKCVVALQEGDPDSLERTAGAIRGRAARVCSVVTQEMDNYEPCIYTKRVLEAVTVLRDQGEWIVIKCFFRTDTKCLK
ncbi:unnamed protein product [Parnassius apollo]|uniref:(apollo) hypothetical protein n=2 Tax=Papilionoidea TaxID=37572 RepID=A0A8S3WCA3_PARAO|nr:unnamed protein product [Parnassius apollo]